MPAFAAHHLLAKQVYDTFRANPRFAQLEERPFLLGAQGPDPLLFHRLIPGYMPGRSARGVSSALHRASPNKIFSAMADYLKEHPERTAAFSYACGFLTHYALDSVAHPYIYYVQSALRRARHIPYIPFIVHNRIEANIDAGIINRILGEPDARKFNAPEQLRAPQPEKMEIGHMMAWVSRRVTGAKWGAETYAQSFDDMRAVQQLLYDPSGKKRGWMAALQAPFYAVAGPFITSLMRRPSPEMLWDFMNDSGAEWHYPADPSIASRDSFEQLFDRAAELSTQMLPAFAALIDSGDPQLFAYTMDRSFLTGIPV